MSSESGGESTPYLKLFRQEVIEAAEQKLQGSVVLRSPRYIRALVAIVFLSGVLVAALVACTPFSRRVSLPGTVTPVNGLVRVTAQSGGVVEAINVREGQTVEKHGAVATIRSTVGLSGADSYASAIGLIERGRKADADGASARLRMLDQEQMVLRERRRLAVAALDSGEERRQLQTEQLELAQEAIARAQSVADRGFLRQSDLDARRATYLSLRQGASDLDDRILSTRRDLLDIDARLAAIPEERAAIRAGSEGANARTGLQETDLSKVSSFSVLAPIGGTLRALTVTVGQTVSAGTVMAIVVPPGERMQAQVLAPSRSLGLLRTGQRVRLRYAAYPYQRFGVGTGIVSSISRTAMTGDDLGSANALPEAMFRVIITLDHQGIRMDDGIAPLLPGAALDADIEIERSSLFQRLKTRTRSSYRQSQVP